MALSLSQPNATAALLADEQDTSPFVSCPMCRTSASLTQSALDAGGDWRCVRCGQRWDAVRLAAVATYAAWVVEHDDVARRRGTEGYAHPAPPPDLPSAQLGGTT